MLDSSVQRLERNIDNLLQRLRRAGERHEQLSSALARSREEVEKLRSELQRFRSERTETRKRIDALLRDFESLELRFEVAEHQ